MSTETSDTPPAHRFNILARARRLSAFDERRSRLKAGGSGYSRFVRGMKFLFLAAILMMTGFVMTRLAEDPLSQVANMPHEKDSAPGQIELLNAQYEGVDEEGRPYTLIAERASRDVEDDKTVLFEKVKGDITLKDGTWIAMHADTGKYATEMQKLSLSGNVALFYDTGYEMHLDDADINVQMRTAKTVHPVNVQGTLGEIQAQGMDVLDAGMRVVFMGPVLLTLRDVGDRG